MKITIYEALQTSIVNKNYDIDNYSDFSKQWLNG